MSVSETVTHSECSHGHLPMNVKAGSGRYIGGKSLETIEAGSEPGRVTDVG